jgi:hypothetical protein
MCDSAPMLGAPAQILAPMAQFPIPNSRTHSEPALHNFLSPRKSWIVIGVVCALSATGLWIGRGPAPIPAVDANTPADPYATPDLDSHAPYRK